MRRLAALALLALALAAPASASDAAALTLSGGGATVHATMPGPGAPALAGEALALSIRVDAPPGVRTAVTVRTPGLVEVDGARCRPADAPDPEYRGWLVCEGAGAWAAALRYPWVALTSPDCPARPLPVALSAAVGGARVGSGTVAGLALACYRAHAPLVRR